ncbi:MAG: hypothetical protein GXO89_02665 [Chlorobi bacterium]|nr:hypothetical protein [Chlorobiota bacterium]
MLEKKLHIDRQSLLELEIISENDRTLSLFDLLDETRTTGGKDKLRKIFLNPFCEIGKINEQQGITRFLTEVEKPWIFPLNGKIMDHIEYYYFLNIDPVVSQNRILNLIEGTRYWILYHGYVKTFKEGIKHLILYFQQLISFVDTYGKGEMPARLKEILSEIKRHLSLPFSRELIEANPKKGASFMQLFYLDKSFRDTFKEEMGLLIDLTYELDVFIAMAKATRKFGFSFPDFSESENSHLEIKGLWHPFVKEPRKNDAVFGKDRYFMFLTGPNMAGKTTFLKACGVAVYLAHLGFGVPSESMKLSVFDSIFSSINTSDNLRKGYSYFYSEVLRVKEAASLLKSHRHSFIIFDELFRGTNVKDALDGSLLVIKGLIKWPSSVFILSSHLLELSKEISKTKGFQFAFFESDVIDNKPIFSYKLDEGVSNERLGLLILENEGIHELLEP